MRMPILHVVTGGAHTTNSSTSSRVWSEKEIFWLQDVIARDYVAMYLEVRVNISSARPSYQTSLLRGVPCLKWHKVSVTIMGL